VDEQSIFLQALEIEDRQKRGEWLESVCGGDDGLKGRIEALLSNQEDVGSFLEQPPAEFEATVLTGPQAGDRAAALEAGLAASFEGDEAVVVGKAGHSVLRVLGQTVDLPRVALRESQAEGDDPVARPNSSEVPQSDSDSRYQLQGEIARGGMGAIIKGRDIDLGRDLAIKVLLDSHKDRPEVIQRFVEEAQIGGQLQHPGIAPIYELGQFSDRRPFFAMKLVKGQTLSRLLGDREDATEERGRFIGIFEQVCQTMAYAHSRGVIHRDLKPANIMVGAFGEVQVMDWGLAKVLSSGGIADEKQSQMKQQGQSIIQTLRSGAGSDSPEAVGSVGSQTQMGSVMGTPAYMPPEQALGEIDQLDQRADVFGLGAILCEILTGQPAYVAENGTQVFRMASRGKLDDAFARLDDCGADAELVTLAKDCLALEPTERPKDAGILAERVTAYLETVEQKLRDTELAKVDAQVRAEELRRRQRLAFRTGSAIVATLLIGTSVSLWQMVRANAAEKLARDEATRATAAEKLARDEATRATAAEQLAKEEAVRATAAEKKTAETLAEVAAERDAKDLARKEAQQVSTFLTDILRSPDPTRDGREIKVVELLDGAAKKLETDLADQPETRASLQHTLAETYVALGLYREAIPLREANRDYHLATSGPEHRDTLSAMNSLAVSYLAAGRYDDARKLLEEVLPLFRKVVSPEHPDTLIVMGNLSSVYGLIGRNDEELKLNEEVLTLLRKVLGPKHSLTLTAMGNLANSYKNADRYDEAIKLGEEVLTLRRKVLGPEDPGTLIAMSNLAIFYDSAGRYDEAVKLCEEVLTLSRKVHGEEHPFTLSVMTILADAFDPVASRWDAGRLDEAVKLHEEVLTLRRKVLGREHPDTLRSMRSLATSYNNLGVALQSQGKAEEAIKLLEKALTLERKVHGEEHPDTLTAMIELAYPYSDLGFELEPQGKAEEAIEAWQKALELNPRIQTNAPYYLGVLLQKAGKHNEAFTAYLIAIRNEVMTGEANKEIQEILNDPENLEACLLAVKAKPDLVLPAFTVFASTGNAEKARSLLAEAAVTNPEETQQAMKLAALQTWFGQEAGFTATQEQMLAWGANTEVSEAAERVAKLSCLLPIPDAESQTAVLTLARKAVELGKDDKAFLPWAHLALGMAEYRNSQYDEAIKSLSTAASTAPEKYQALISGTANFYHTMCLFQLGKKDEAQTLFTTTEESMRPLPTDENNPLADKANHDHLILWLAYREAKALLGVTDSSTADGQSEKE
jgi:serine/threonine protein kinase/tetratricopeptide (TPR) repeat protein